MSLPWNSSFREIQLQAAVEIDPQRLKLRFTNRGRDDRGPSTLKLSEIAIYRGIRDKTCSGAPAPGS